MAYCTQTDIEDILSREGLIDRADDTGEATIVDAGLVERLISQATQRVNVFLSRKYKTADLEGNAYIADVTATVAAVYFCRRRGNPVPLGLEESYVEYMKELEQIRDGYGEVPELSPRAEPGLAMSNLTVDDRYRTQKVRVQTTISAGDKKSKKPRHLLPWEVFDRPY